MSSHYTKEERESYVKAWKKSKLSQEAYCKIKGLAWSTFKNWCKPTRRVKQNYPLVPIQVTDPQDGKRASLTLQSPQGWQIKVNGDVDERQLQKVIQLLGETAC